MMRRIRGNKQTTQPQLYHNWPAWFMALAVLAITSLTAYGVSLREEAIVVEEFEDRCHEILKKIEERIHIHAQILRGGVAFVEIRSQI